MKNKERRKEGGGGKRERKWEMNKYKQSNFSRVSAPICLVCSATLKALLAASLDS